MTIKETEELKMLADASGKKPYEVADIIVNELLKRNIVKNSKDNWGGKIEDCFENEVNVSEIANVIASVGIYPVRSVHVEAIANCIIIGDFDCPECGGEMEVTDGEYICIGGDGYLTPYEYKPKWEERKCINCGHVESNEPSY